MQSKASKLPFYDLGWRTFVKLSLVRKLTVWIPSGLLYLLYLSRTSRSDCLYGKIKIHLLCWLLKAGPWKSSSLVFYACKKPLRVLSDHDRQSYWGTIYSTSFPFSLYYLDSLAMFIKKIQLPYLVTKVNEKWRHNQISWVRWCLQSHVRTHQLSREK